MAAFQALKDMLRRAINNDSFATAYTSVIIAGGVVGANYAVLENLQMMKKYEKKVDMAKLALTASTGAFIGAGVGALTPVFLVGGVLAMPALTLGALTTITKD